MNYDKVKAIIDNWDPVDLLAIHCPPDEYDSETRKIANQIVSDDINEVANIIQSVFLKAFGKDIFDKSIDECQEIAKQIIF